MARTVISAVTGSASAFTPYTFAAGDSGNGNYITATSALKPELLVKNNHGSVDKLVTIYDKNNNKIQYKVPFGTTVRIGPLSPATFAQSDKINVDPESTDIQFALILLP